MSDYFDCQTDVQEDLDAAVAAAVDAIRNELLIVTPTDTVYGIAADAFSPDAVAHLLETKGRGRDMPPPVLLPGVSTVDGVATDISDDARLLMTNFWPGALTLIVWAQPTLQWDLGDTEGTVAVRVPSHPLALDVLSATGPLAVSSANRTGADVAASGREAQHIFDQEVACYLDAGPGGGAQPSTIVDATREPLRILRSGAISTAQLRAVVPGIVDEQAGEQPGSQA